MDLPALLVQPAHGIPFPIHAQNNKSITMRNHGQKFRERGEANRVQHTGRQIQDRCLTVAAQYNNTIDRG